MIFIYHEFSVMQSIWTLIFVDIREL